MDSKERQSGGILQGRYKAPQFEVSYNSLPGKVSMHDDLMQEGLLKEDKGIDSFITIGESPHSDSQRIQLIPGRKVCIRVVSQFGEESFKVITIE